MLDIYIEILLIIYLSICLSTDALGGLRELFRMHPSVLAESLGALVNIFAGLLVDEDDDVRKSLYSFLDEFLPTLNKVSDIQLSSRLTNSRGFLLASRIWLLFYLYWWCTHVQP
jgi:hypothetical protein